MFELKVKVKGEDQTLIKKFLVYEEDILLNDNEEKLHDYVVQSLDGFKGVVDTIQLTATLEWPVGN